MKRKRNSYFSFLIVLPNNRKTFSLRIPNLLIFSIGSGFLGVIFILFFAFYFSVRTSYKLNDYTSLKIESNNQIKQIHRFNSQMNAVKNDLKKLADKEQTIKGLLGEADTSHFSRDRGFFGTEKKKY